MVDSAVSQGITSSSTTSVSTATKSKLQSLGYYSVDNISETEAQQIIEQLKQAKADLDNTNVNSESVDVEEEQAQNSSETQVLSDAKSLASKMGITVSSDDSADDILDKISLQIKKLASSSNESDRKLAQSYQKQLQSISSQYQTIQASQNNIYSAMNLISSNNKYSMNL